MGAFAGAAAIAFAGAYIGPAGLALAAAPVPASTHDTVYALTVGDAQSFVTGENVTSGSLQRSGYAAYEKPKPVVVPAVVAAQNASESSSSAAPLYYSGGGSASDWMAAAGIAQSDWAYVDYIVSRESGWNPNATNSSSGACGLVQALPCGKVPGGNGYDPVANLEWGNGYAVGRYGSWAAAYEFWSNNHWW